jgi:hypothetical protein
MIHIGSKRTLLSFVVAASFSSFSSAQLRAHGVGYSFLVDVLFCQSAKSAIGEKLYRRIRLKVRYLNADRPLQLRTEHVQLHLIAYERKESGYRAICVSTVEILEILNLLEAHSPVTIAINHVEDGSDRIGRINVRACQRRSIPIHVQQVAEGFGSSVAYAGEHLSPAFIRARSWKSCDIAVLVHNQTHGSGNAWKHWLGL